MNEQQKWETLRAELAAFPPVMLAVPQVAWQWTESAAAIARVALPHGSLVVNNDVYSSSISVARNRLAEVFLRNAETYGLEHMLWIDSDMVPPPDAALRLLRRARETGGDMVTALYFSRQMPFAPLCWDLDRRRVDPDAGRTDPFEVAACGFGCVLLRRRVLDLVPQPWFDMNVPGWSEDLQFCEAARGAGARIFIDPTFEVGHLSVVSIGRDFVRAWNASRGPAPVTP